MILLELSILKLLGTKNGVVIPPEITAYKPLSSVCLLSPPVLHLKEFPCAYCFCYTGSALSVFTFHNGPQVILLRGLSLVKT